MGGTRGANVQRAAHGALASCDVDSPSSPSLVATVRTSGTPTANVKQRLVFCGTEEGKIIALRRYLMGEEVSAACSPGPPAASSSSSSEENLGVRLTKTTTRVADHDSSMCIPSPHASVVGDTVRVDRPCFRRWSCLCSARSAPRTSTRPSAPKSAASPSSTRASATAR